MTMTWPQFVERLNERAKWLRKEYLNGGSLEHLSAREKECTYIAGLAEEILAGEPLPHEPAGDPPGNGWALEREWVEEARPGFHRTEMRSYRKGDMRVTAPYRVTIQAVRPVPNPDNPQCPVHGIGEWRHLIEGCTCPPKKSDAGHTCDISVACDPCDRGEDLKDPL